MCKRKGKKISGIGGLRLVGLVRLVGGPLEEDWVSDWSDWSDWSENILLGLFLPILDFALDIIAGAGLVGVHLAVAADASGGVVPVEEAEEGLERSALGAGSCVLRSAFGVDAADVGHMDGVLVVALHAVGHVFFRPEAAQCAVGLDHVVIAGGVPTAGAEAIAERLDGGGRLRSGAMHEDVVDSSHGCCWFLGLVTSFELVVDVDLHAEDTTGVDERLGCKPQYAVGDFTQWRDDEARDGEADTCHQHTDGGEF